MRHLALTLAGLVLAAGPAAAQTTHEIDVFNFDFGINRVPFDPVITVGDTVRWRWLDPGHSTTSVDGQAESWDSGTLFGTGLTYEKNFTQVGTFDYFCEPHITIMTGQITVIPVPEPAGVLLAAGLAGAAAWGWRRRGVVRSRSDRTGEVRSLRDRTTPRRPAATLIELLVVIAILAVFLGLLLPAVQRTRESASYVTCRNNLKQIGLALHNYESAHGQFPGPGVEPRQESVLARLLPFLDQDNLRQRIATDRPLFIPLGDYGRLDPAQAEAARTTVRSFLCPSDGRSPVFTAYDFATLAGGNYVANAGTGTGTAYDFRYPTDGTFWYGSKLRHRDVTDGLSSTMFFSEALLGAGADNYEPARVDRRRHWASVVCAVWPAANRPGTDPPLTDEVCMMTTPGMTWRGDRAVSWVGGPGHRGLLDTYRMPNDAMIDCGVFGLGWFKASSGHPGGVNMVLGDGSVHFIKDHIDLETWRALSTRGDREAIGSYCGCK